MTIYSGFSHWKRWFSIAMLVYQRVFPIYFGGPCSWTRARLRSEDLSLALGPGSSSWGRRPRRQLATVSMGDVAAESESDNSEPDLGDVTLDLWDLPSGKPT